MIQLLKSILPYVGSSEVTLEHILPNIPLDSEVYIEPFCGSCATVLALLQTRPNHFYRIICADKDENVIGFWQAIQDYGVKFIDSLINFLSVHDAEEVFSRDSWDSYEQIMVFYIRMHCSVSSKGYGKVFSEARYYSLIDKFNKESFRESVAQCQELISPINFYNVDFKEAIGVGASIGASTGKKTVCFADPPYLSEKEVSTQWYKHDKISLTELKEALEWCDNFVLSHSPHSSLDMLFEGYKSKEVKLTRGVCKRKEVYIYK